jgi:hypothetical protein
MFLNSCNVSEQLQCVWTIAMCLNSCSVSEQLQCVWTVAMCLNGCNVSGQLQCIWTVAMYLNSCNVSEQLQCVWSVAMILNSCNVSEQLQAGGLRTMVALFQCFVLLRSMLHRSCVVYTQRDAFRGWCEAIGCGYKRWHLLQKDTHSGASRKWSVAIGFKS